MGVGLKAIGGTKAAAGGNIVTRYAANQKDSMLYMFSRSTSDIPLSLYTYSNLFVGSRVPGYLVSDALRSMVGERTLWEVFDGERWLGYMVRGTFVPANSPVATEIARSLTSSGISAPSGSAVTSGGGAIHLPSAAAQETMRLNPGRQFTPCGQGVFTPNTGRGSSPGVIIWG
jgi:hypothetical protein